MTLSTRLAGFKSARNCALVFCGLLWQLPAEGQPSQTWLHSSLMLGSLVFLIFAGMRQPAMLAGCLAGTARMVQLVMPALNADAFAMNQGIGHLAARAV